MEIIEYGLTEFKLFPVKNEIKGAVLDLLCIFDKQGHSGYSAKYTISLFKIAFENKNILPTESGIEVNELLKELNARRLSQEEKTQVVKLFYTLANFEPLSPLTGESWEWWDIDNTTKQNKRCPRVFRSANGDVDIQGKLFRDKDGSLWNGSGCSVPITFPYVPSTEIVPMQGSS